MRFVYVRAKNEYLQLEGIRDVIEFQLDKTLDINGWDISKALKLLHESNPVFLSGAIHPLFIKLHHYGKI